MQVRICLCFQSSEEDGGLKESIPPETNSPREKVASTKLRNTPSKVKAASKVKGSAVKVTVKNQKEALHPDIEQILAGQAQAQSLPLITALCNDLMTGSTHSSTGSYDTMRSVESDSRRWSTCGPMETSVESVGNVGTMLIKPGTSVRPYSWHFENIPFSLPGDLNSLQSTSNTPKTPPSHHHHHPTPSQPPQTAQSLPHDLCKVSRSGKTTHSVLWTQAVGGGVEGEGGGGVTDRYSPELIAQQLMIPSRLNSGGRMVGVSDSGHKLMKENIGIA